jgi:hypothetical protein
MRNFLTRFLALTLSASASLAYGDFFDSLMRTEGHVNLGTMRLETDGNLTSIPTRLTTPTDWFRSDNFAPNFFNIGTTSASNALQEYVSFGIGRAPGTIVTGFDLWYAANTANGTLQIQLNIYDGFDFSASPQPSAAQFSINLPTSQGTAGIFLYNVSIELPESLRFSLNNSEGEFAYGMRRTAGDGAFGPVLQQNISNQGASQIDNTINASVGSTANILELWSGIDKTNGSRVALSWFGPTGPWAANAFSLQSIPEPNSGLILLVFGTTVILGRRRS